jgi:predicted CXXCH cytochrome family protein
MRRLWNSKKGKIIFRSGLFALSSKLYAKRPMLLALCSMLLALCYLLYPKGASSGPYLSSAHGGQNGTITGVHRTSVSDYAAGNCVHCHEEHASIGGAEPAPVDGNPSKYELFTGIGQNQGSRFCYNCHQDSGSSVQNSMPSQYSYSYLAGGDITLTCPNNIAQAFDFLTGSCDPKTGWCGSGYNDVSAHCLSDIQTFLKKKWNFPGAANINACSGCHNPHRTQKDHDQTAQKFQWVNGVSALSRPRDHSNDNSAWVLWGDDSTERMSNYNYQPPYRYSSTTYEPDGWGASDASRTVDFVALCMDCHNTTISSTRYGTLEPIDWSASGDMHGGGIQPDCVCDCGDKKPPYSDGINYVMSCLDCHEPHGSPNAFLLRAEINGTHLGAFGFSSGYWYNFCTACHQNLTAKHVGIGPSSYCNTICHSHGSHNNSYPVCCTGSCTSNHKSF